VSRPPILLQKRCLKLRHRPLADSRDGAFADTQITGGAGLPLTGQMPLDHFLRPPV